MKRMILSLAPQSGDWKAQKTASESRRPVAPTHPGVGKYFCSSGKPESRYLPVAKSTPLMATVMRQTGQRYWRPKSSAQTLARLALTMVSKLTWSQSTGRRTKISQSSRTRIQG
nr:TPA_asm: m102.5 ORF [Murid betaherpesvirus 1]DBA08051.1 TPA_asm: m102.5 ORF [Murid betaherpesvirus 1]